MSSHVISFCVCRRHKFAHVCEYMRICYRYWAPNGLFLPVPVSTDEPSTTASSSVGKSTKTQTSTSPSSLHDVHIDVDTVKTAISRHIEAIEIPPTAVVERHKAGKRGKRRALVVVLAAKPIALSKFQR